MSRSRASSYLPCGAPAAIAFLATVHKIERSPASSAYSIRSSPRSSRMNETMMLCMAGPSSSRVVDLLVAIAEGFQCNEVARQKMMGRGRQVRTRDVETLENVRHSAHLTTVISGSCGINLLFVWIPQYFFPT